MHQVIVAFERQSHRDRFQEALESTGEFSCLPCCSADQVKRAVHELRPGLVVCGFKLGEESCESVYHDLPQRCTMLMLAPQSQLELCETKGIFKLPVPVRRSELLASARLLVQLSQGRDRSPQRSQEERELVERAKQLLIARRGMTEEQAHRFLQKRSMDSGTRLADTARGILEDT